MEAPLKFDPQNKEPFWTIKKCTRFPKFSDTSDFFENGTPIKREGEK